MVGLSASSQSHQVRRSQHLPQTIQHLNISAGIPKPTQYNLDFLNCLAHYFDGENVALCIVSITNFRFRKATNAVVPRNNICHKSVSAGRSILVITIINNYQR